MEKLIIIFSGSFIILAISSLAVLLLRAARLSRGNTPPSAVPPVNEEIAARAAESLSSAVAMQTISRSDDSQHGYAEWLHLREFLRVRYPLLHERLEREIVSNYSLLYCWKSNNAKRDPILLCAHMDVVPAPGKWAVPPFSGEIKDGYVHGRGTLDCKNVLICIMEAVEGLLEQNFEPDRDIYLAFGHDEEIGGVDGAREIAKIFARENLRFDLVLDEGGSITRSAVPIGRPAAHVCVAEKGMVNLRFIAHGAGGHASTPPKRTTLGHLCEAVCRVEFKPLKARLTPLIKDHLLALSPDLPYKWRFYLANAGIFKNKLISELLKTPETAALIRTTIAPTVATGGSAANILPDRAEVTLNARLLHGENEAAFEHYLTELTAELNTDVEILISRSPSRISKYNGSMFRSVAASVSRVFGPTPTTPSLMCGGTDALNYEAFSDCVYRFIPFILTPTELALIHNANERVSVNALGLAVEFYKDIIKSV